MNSKKRLEAFLNPQERKELVLALLKDVLIAATNSKSTESVLLITPDAEIINITKTWGFAKIKFLLEPVEQGINHAVQFAMNWCLSKSISSILIIPADIPLITSDILDELLESGNSEYPAIISPSQRKDGTNALYQQPPNLFKVWYGSNSFQKNLKIIQEQKIPYKIFENDACALDIDLKEDLKALKRSKINSISVQFVKTLKI